jgi:hypothetical protein
LGLKKVVTKGKVMAAKKSKADCAIELTEKTKQIMFFNEIKIKEYAITRFFNYIDIWTDDTIDHQYAILNKLKFNHENQKIILY